MTELCASGPISMTTNYLKNFFKAHSISYKVHGCALLFFSIGAFLLSALAFNNVLAETAVAIISENLAPKTFHVTCTVSLIFLSGFVAFRGPIQNLSGWSARIFGVYFANTTLAIGAAYVGIAWGVFLAAVVSGVNLPSQYSYQILLWACIKLLLALLVLFIFLVLLTVNQTVAPGYSKPQFARNMRICCGLFFIAIVGRTFLLVCIALSQAK